MSSPIAARAEPTPSVAPAPEWISERPIPASNPASKNIGGAASVAQLRAHNAAVPVAGVGVLASLTSSPSYHASYKLTEPLVITPGAGVMLITSAAVALELAATYEFIEEAI